MYTDCGCVCPFRGLTASGLDRKATLAAANVRSISRMLAMMYYTREGNGGREEKREDGKEGGRGKRARERRGRRSGERREEHERMRKEEARKSGEKRKGRGA